MEKLTRDPLSYAKAFARRNPADDGQTDALVRQLAKCFSRAQLTRTEAAIGGRKPSAAQARQLNLVRRARRLTFQPLDRRWT
jgi:hypothetical protein